MQKSNLYFGMCFIPVKKNCCPLRQKRCKVVNFSLCFQMFSSRVGGSMFDLFIHRLNIKNDKASPSLVNGSPYCQANEQTPYLSQESHHSCAFCADSRIADNRSWLPSPEHFILSTWFFSALPQFSYIKQNMFQAVLSHLMGLSVN